MAQVVAWQKRVEGYPFQVGRAHRHYLPERSIWVGGDGKSRTFWRVPMGQVVGWRKKADVHLIRVRGSPRHRLPEQMNDLRGPSHGAYCSPQLLRETGSLLSWKDCNLVAFYSVSCPGSFTSLRRGKYLNRRVNCLDDESSPKPESCSGDKEPSLQPYGIPVTCVPDRWDVIGLGQAMVDFSASVGDEFLNGLDLLKGSRKVVNHEERGKVLRALDGCSYKVTAGGSLSNTLVALARLGAGYNNDPPLNVAMTGSVGSDALGGFYRTKLLRANVHFLSEPVTDGTTGTVIVCTTPDAHRTMLSYQGMSSIINYDEALQKQISMSRVLVVEGYLWELPETVETIARACKNAREQGILVALTASDISCINRHREKMWNVMAESADILFSNCDEARALLGGDSSMSPADAAKLLSSHCPLVSVTDGSQGSYIGLKGEVSFIQSATCVPVDSCGAGDAYAAGLLYGLLRGIPDLKGIGNLAARVAAVVVGQQGTRLREEDAEELAGSVPTVPCLLEGLNLNMSMESGRSLNV